MQTRQPDPKIFRTGSAPVEKTRRVIRLPAEAKAKGVDFAAADLDWRAKYSERKRQAEAEAERLRRESTLSYKLARWWRGLTRQTSTEK